MFDHEHLVANDTRMLHARQALNSLGYGLTLSLVLGWTSTATAAPEHHEAAPASDDSDGAQRESVDEVAAEEHQSTFDPAGLGLFLWLGGGLTAGDDVNPTKSVFEPTAAMSFRFELSYAYYYFGAGLASLYFKDRDPLKQEVVFATTGGDAGTKSGSADATAFDVELGVAHSFLFADRGWALRPGLGAGWQTSPEVTRIITDCQGCDKDVVLAEYTGGPFARVQLGLHKRTPMALGLSVMYQQFLGEVDEPAMNWALLFGLVYGVDGH